MGLLKSILKYHFLLLMLLACAFAHANIQDSLLKHIKQLDGNERIEAYKDLLSTNLSPQEWQLIFNEAIEYSESISSESKAELFYIKGIYHKGRFELDEAINAFSNGIELLTEFPENKWYSASFIQRASTFSMAQDQESADRDFKLAFEIIEKYDVKESLAIYYRMYGNYMRSRGMGIEAITNYNKAMNAYAELGSKVRVITSKYDIAQQYMLMGLYENAKIGFLEVIQETEEDYKPIYLDASLSLAHIYFQLDQLNSAKKYFEAAANGFENINEKVRVADAYFGLAKCYFKEEDYEKAFEYFKESEQIYTENNAIGVEYPMFGMGSCNMNFKSFDKAIKLFQSALIISKKNNDIIATTQGYINLGSYYSKIGMPELSTVYFDSAKSNLNVYPYDLLYQDYYKALIDHFTKIEDFNSAFHVQSEFSSYRDSLVSAKIKLSNEDVRIKLETARIEKENSELTKKLITEELKQQRLIWASSLSVIILLLISILFFSRYKLNKQKTLAQTERIERIKLEKEALELEQQKSQSELLSKNKLLEISSVHLVKLAASANRFMSWLKEIRPYTNNEGKQKIHSYLSELTQESNHDHWLEFERTFVELYPFAKQKIAENYPDLTQNEFRFICFLLMDLSQTEIAQLTLQSNNSVRSVFYRLRKKLDVDSQEELSILLKNLFS